MGTVIVGIIVLGVLALSVRSMIKSKKSGKSLQCGCDCKDCGGHCH
ncbi:FeoB-associated Cys-rich membrane protein [Clostridium oryzae]|uniref:Virus attachment protein p12 family protein n=1 Tax=Clostridium oryzae TaxID=1450648 RepID=A0A1V4IWL8_9CLOT|nr:FeoB-associated Cys-rich membrane protein [Clostridium oryzae]OPJ64210.1 virus attachment protein p12 family protein [Clostridium oryzae]